jgi:hypothetical protein
MINTIENKCTLNTLTGLGQSPLSSGPLPELMLWGMPLLST